MDEAIQFYRDALKLRPDWAEGWWYLGTLNYDADRYANAVRALQHLVGLSPKMGPGLAFLGLSEFETQDYKSSLLHLWRAREQGYGDDEGLASVATYHLALLFNWSGQFEKALEVLGPSAARGNPSDSVKAALGMAVLRVPLLASEVDPGKDALIQGAGEAVVLLRAGDAVAAADTLQKLLIAYPQTPYLNLAYADALARAGKKEDALRALAAEIRISPGSAFSYARIARLKLQLHQAKDALPPARKAVALSPRWGGAHEVLAETLQALGRNEEASSELVAAKKLDSNSGVAELTQRARYARSQAPENGRHISGTAGDPEQSFDALVQKAGAAQAAGQADSAIAYCKRALALRPDWEEGWRNLGTMYFTSAQYPDAVGALKRAVALNDRNGNVWALLGLSEFESDDYKNALIHLERGRDAGFAGNASAVQVARYHLGILLNKNGEFDQATQQLAPEARSGPMQQEVRFALGMALLRIPMLPEEVVASTESTVRLAGETAALLSESKYDQAFSDFEQLIKMSPSTPYLHYAYGSALASASRYDEADAQLAQETSITPGSALPWLRRSSIALQLHQSEKATQIAERALQLAPESAEGHYLLGRCRLALARTVDAVKELETARSLAPNSPEVHFSLAQAYAKAGQTELAGHERSEFERLNALMQGQQTRTGNQSYGAIQDRNGIRAAEGSGQTTSDSHRE